MSGDQLTLLPAESLASLSVWPGSRQARRMTVTSGRKLLASLPSCDRELSWLRTLVGSSAWRSTMCLLTWKHKTTPAGRSYYQLQVSAPRIDEIGSGLWPTPVANDDNKSPAAHMAMKKRMKGGPRNTITSLQVAVKATMLPTPNASKAGNDVTLTCSGDGRQKPNKLGWAVAMLPTPQVSPGRNNTSGRSDPESKHHSGETIYDLAYREGGGVMKLNPAWVSRMMGFPDEWMDLD